MFWIVYLSTLKRISVSESKSQARLSHLKSAKAEEGRLLHWAFLSCSLQLEFGVPLEAMLFWPGCYLEQVRWKPRRFFSRGEKYHPAIWLKNAK